MIATFLTAAGGLALFLLAMAMMTDGLKLFGGAGLRIVLRDWTSTPLRGASSGALVTAVVQSSSAVTVATLGFTNAGVLTLRQALAVVFGSNVGTTMTGWLVSITGLGFKIDAMALPILALGVALRMAASGKRLEGLGNALAGFGLFFLGLAILKEAFAGMSGDLGGQLVVADEGFVGILIYVGLGFIATVLTQSSSAAIAIILTAATQSVIGIEAAAAAAAIIGANVGTTSTAFFAVIKATPNAKRVAVGHFVFNAVTGLVAIAMLPAFIAFISLIGAWFDVADDPVPLLALFHTVFNLMGLALLLPFANPMADRLEKLFRTAEEDQSRPQHLDNTVLSAPVLAMDALGRELRRLASLVHGLALTALVDDRTRPKRLRRESEAIATLGEAITEFATSIRMETLPRAAAEALPRALRVTR
ncbi:MAG: Na/Pi cotransporter family protein [Rhodospirillaceae bacterium]|jgi:phosphate:Na+ symporter|nr:Na/Pi cotransporter family protein [Rhodospirillaceae bacterium]MBT7614134.1 Na/Pi cotransporter family protein [Rhodospirillaceae bacterium]MBT7648412.1 Na/Pi cotransporter family protein [Rhodospirillaceae bacterium]